MTNPTPHGQVPEALRLAEEISNLVCSSEAAAKTIAAAADELCRLHVENASLRAALAASPTPPALSAAPEAFLKSVIALCSHRGHSPANIEAWDKDDKWIADLWRQAESMLAATPTPPAEQQAAPQPAPTLPEGWTDCTIEFGNDGPEVVAYGPKRMMTRLAKWLGKYFAQVIADAATKAAPGEPSDADIDAFLDSPGGIEWVIADKRERYRLLVRAVLAKWAAPQQEAQEPVATLHCNDIGYVWARATEVGKLMRFEQPLNLYTAPQPAPAPLSDDISQKTWALIDELEKLRSANRDEEDWDTLNRRDDELRAAMTAIDWPTADRAYQHHHAACPQCRAAGVTRGPLSALAWISRSREWAWVDALHQPSRDVLVLH